MKIARHIIITCFLFVSVSVQSQFFTEIKTGYNFSLSKFGSGIDIINPIPTDLRRHPLSYLDENKDISTIKPTLGSGINNEITFGYKTTFFAIKLSAGANINKINFRNKNNTISETEINTYTDQSDSGIPSYWQSGFDNYLTTEYSYSMDFDYSIYYINPELSIFHDFNKFSVGVSAGISYNFVRFQVHAQTLAAGYNDSWNRQTTYTSTCDLSPEKQTLDEASINISIRPTRETIVSYTLSLDFQYKLNDNFSAICNIKYKPLIYTPTVIIYEDQQSTYNDNGDIQTVDYNDQITTLNYDYLFPIHNWYEIRSYDFSTIGISLGIKYIFGKSQPNEN
ncbi:MAG: hypothetical protein RBR97_16335 [Bacteroidales bacterium]|nr:hypothetical protein [Bacteroidales bacterium]